MAARCAWVITQDFDNPYDEDAELRLPTHVGVAGPGTATDENIRRALNEGAFLQMLHDDGNPHYLGHCWSIDGPGSEDMFGPLDDYGCADVGATDIQYRVTATAKPYDQLPDS